MFFTVGAVREAQARQRAASKREAQARQRAASKREAQARQRAASKNDRRQCRTDRLRVVTKDLNEVGEGPSPLRRGRREAPGEGRKSIQILRPSPCPLPEGEGGPSAIPFIHG